MPLFARRHIKTSALRAAGGGGAVSPGLTRRRKLAERAARSVLGSALACARSNTRPASTAITRHALQTVASITRAIQRPSRSAGLDKISSRLRRDDEPAGEFAFPPSAVRGRCAPKNTRLGVHDLGPPARGPRARWGRGRRPDGRGTMVGPGPSGSSCGRLRRGLLGCGFALCWWCGGVRLLQSLRCPAQLRWCAVLQIL